MKRQNWLVVALVALSPLLALISLNAAEEGWVTLFNGKDLTGWKNAEDGKFEVVDGTLKVSGPRAHLYTEKEFKNFEFKAESKTTPGSNSGLYFHTKFQETSWPEYGYEAQVNVSHGDKIKTGSLYSVVNVEKTAAKDDEWYETHIIVKGKHITIKINGETTVDWEEPEGYKHPQFANRKLGKGSFAIQAHDPKSVVYFRNIRVKALPD